MTLTAEPVTLRANPRQLISEKLFATLSKRLAESEGWELAHAERVMEQTLIFLKASADNPALSLSPTIAVDPGWHTFILHTEDYAAWCEDVAGFFIHHRPICNEDIMSGTALARTVPAMLATGYDVDMELWTVVEGKCHQCHATCVDSN